MGETFQRDSGAIVLLVRRMHGAPKDLMARFPKPRAFRGGGWGVVVVVKVVVLLVQLLWGWSAELHPR